VPDINLSTALDDEEDAVSFEPPSAPSSPAAAVNASRGRAQ